MPLSFRLHDSMKIAFIGIVTTAVLLLFLWIVCCKCRCFEPEIQSVRTLVSAPASGCSSACIDVHGRVLGDVLPGSAVHLYQVSSTEPEVVLHEIRSREPIDWAAVDASKRFGFECISPGDYAFVVPASSYNRSVGAPLPDQIECGNLFVEVAFQGGDGQYMVGGFSVNQSCGKA